MAKLKSESWNIIIRSLLSLLLIGIIVFGVLDFYQVAAGTQNWVGKFTLTWGLAIAGMTGVGMAAFGWGMLSLWIPERLQSANQRLAKVRNALGWSRWLLVVLIGFIPAKIFLYTPLGFKLTGVGFRLALFCASAVLMAVLSTQDRNKPLSWNGVFVGVIVLGSMFACAKALVAVVDHPLSLTWSEGNRIWDYSVLFGRDLYNYPENQGIEAYIDRGRQTLWGLPFLLPNISIVGVRLWSAIVFTIPYAILGWISFRPQTQHRKQWLWLGLWSFLFISQGPIYTPLILSAILVVGVRHKPLWLALPLIFLSGHYAQDSRITWIVAPAIWAALVALLDIEEKRNGKLSLRNWGTIAVFGLAGFFGGFGLLRGWRRLYNYFTRAAAANAAQLTAVPAQNTYVNPGDSVEAISSVGQSSVFSNQPFLLDRLWPNPTYNLGILLGVLLAVGPFFILLFYLIRSKNWKLNTWQKIGLFGVLLSLLAAGIIFSLKIGGGGDLHNLDMFLISCVLAAGLAWEYGGYRLFLKLDAQSIGVKITLLLAAFIPAFMPWIDAKPIELPPEDKTQWTLELLRNETDRVVEEGGEILFMDQRQLLTFSYLGDIPLVPEYEKKLVMDRAMSGDIDYLNAFYKDLSNQRFALIISDPQRIRYADEDENWGAENDIWVHWVTQPLLCFYDPVYAIKKTGVWILEPKENPGSCPYP